MHREFPRRWQLPNYFEILLIPERPVYRLSLETSRKVPRYRSCRRFSTETALGLQSRNKETFDQVARGIETLPRGMRN